MSDKETKVTELKDQSEIVEEENKYDKNKKPQTNEKETSSESLIFL